MHLYFQLAWRNLWRNRRRSAISISSAIFAVAIALGMRSMQLGFYTRTIDNVVSFYTGYLQVHAPEYQEKQSLEESFTRPDSIARIVEGISRVTVTAPRLESFALISAGDITDGVRLVGVDPEREDLLTGLRKRIDRGRYLRSDDRGILLASGLADHLRMSVGDTVVVLSSGYHAISAAARYPVIGTVHFPTVELNSSMAYLALQEAQWFYGAQDRVTSLVVMIEEPRHLDEVEARTRDLAGEDYEIVTWKTMMPEMVQYIELDNASGIIMLVLIYTIVGFGILGTVLMMTMERMREFGMLVGIGMSKGALRGVLLFESVLLALHGAILGMMLAFPILVYLNHHPIRLTGAYARAIESYGFEPILPFSLDPSIFLWQTITVLLIAFAAGIYPLVRIARLNVVDAMRTGL